MTDDQERIRALISSSPASGSIAQALQRAASNPRREFCRVCDAPFVHTGMLVPICRICTYIGSQRLLPNGADPADELTLREWNRRIRVFEELTGRRPPA